MTGATPVPGKNTAFSPSPYGHLNSGPYVQEPPPPYLFVDSLKPIEIVVSFTAFSKWLDPPQPILKEKDKEREKDSASSVAGKSAPNTPNVVLLNSPKLSLQFLCKQVGRIWVFIKDKLLFMIISLINWLNFSVLVFVELKPETAAEDKPPPPSPGLLVAEPYSWKSVVTGQPVLRIRTTGTKAAVLCLPAG